MPSASNQLIIEWDLHSLWIQFLRISDEGSHSAAQHCPIHNGLLGHLSVSDVCTLLLSSPFVSLSVIVSASFLWIFTDILIPHLITLLNFVIPMKSIIFFFSFHLRKIAYMHFCSSLQTMHKLFNYTSDQLTWKWTTA